MRTYYIKAHSHAQKSYLYRKKCRHKWIISCDPKYPIHSLVCLGPGGCLRKGSVLLSWVCDCLVSSWSFLERPRAEPQHCVLPPRYEFRSHTQNTGVENNCILGTLSCLEIQSLPVESEVLLMVEPILKEMPQRNNPPNKAWEIVQRFRCLPHSHTANTNQSLALHLELLGALLYHYLSLTSN